MNRSVGLVLVLLVACILVTAPVSALTESTENSWVSKTPMQEARGYLGVVAVNGKVYAIGGSTTSGGWSSYNGSVVGTNEEYDPITDTWTFTASMPTPRYTFAIAAYENKIYCIGGETSNGSITAVNEVYDPATDEWETKTPMPTPRVNLQASVVNGLIYLIGGYVPDNSDFGLAISNLNEVYDPATDTWTTKAPLPTASADYVSAVVNNRLFVIGGESEVAHSNLNQIYDSGTDTWGLGAPSPSGIRYGACAAGVTTGVNAPVRVYVLGKTWQLWGGEPPNSVRVYDPESDSWTFGANVPTEREGFGVAVVDDLLYVIGGSTITYPNLESWSMGGIITKYATVERYTPFGYVPVPPSVSIVSLQNLASYTSSDVSLNFSLNKPVAWVGYSLDGKDNITIAGNTTITGLSAGLHNITIYAKDENENIGASETLTFTITPAPFPTLPLAAASTASVAIVCVGVFFCLRKRKS